MKHDLRRGEIKHNAIHALVTSPLFRSRIEANKKGKGGYKRNDKNWQRDNSKTNSSEFLLLFSCISIIKRGKSKCTINSINSILQAFKAMTFLFV